MRNFNVDDNYNAMSIHYLGICTCLILDQVCYLPCRNVDLACWGHVCSALHELWATLKHAFIRDFSVSCPNRCSMEMSPIATASFQVDCNHRSSECVGHCPCFVNSRLS